MLACSSHRRKEEQTRASARWRRMCEISCLLPARPTTFFCTPPRSRCVQPTIARHNNAADGRERGGGVGGPGSRVFKIRMTGGDFFCHSYIDDGDVLPAFGRQIRDVLGPTLTAYEPLLLNNEAEIRSVPKHTFQYGPTDRQQLDLYSTAKPGLKNGRQPVLMFLYGGGLIHGHRTLPGYAKDLCHANMAAFFALRCGYTTMVVDYRLVHAHDAKFPSGGEDVALAIEWLLKNTVEIGPEPIDLYLMGNSAGGIHVSTFLLHPSFAETRKKVIHGNSTRLRGSILLSVPFHFQDAHPSRTEILETYFENYETNSPLGLLRTARQKGTIDILGTGHRLFILNGELDPESENMEVRDDFVIEWLLVGSDESRNALSVDMMPGQNHISPFLSLGTNLEREEAWGHQVVAFCDNIRKFGVN